MNVDQVLPDLVQQTIGEPHVKVKFTHCSEVVGADGTCAESLEFAGELMSTSDSRDSKRWPAQVVQNVDARPECFAVDCGNTVIECEGDPIEERPIAIGKDEDTRPEQEETTAAGHKPTQAVVGQRGPAPDVQLKRE